MANPNDEMWSSKKFAILLDRLSEALEYANAGVVIAPEAARKLFENPSELKAAILACWLAQEQGTSDWNEELTYPPDLALNTLAAWLDRCVGSSKE